MATAPPPPARRRYSRRLILPGPFGLVRFRAACTAPAVYLLVGGPDGAATALLRMEAKGAGHWRLALRLTPGAYRYRYCAPGDGVIPLVPPGGSDDAPVRMSGPDAVLHVSAHTCQTAAAGRLACAAGSDGPRRGSNEPNMAAPRNR